MADNILKTHSKLINDGVKFSSCAQEKPEIITDYIPPFGDGKSTTPLELLLISFSSCVGGAVTPLLRRMGKTVKNLEISATGQRKTEHPTCFETITLYITLTSPDTTQEDLQKVLAISEASICPVWAMIKGNAKINIDYRIIV
jgi:putative redox protein